MHLDMRVNGTTKLIGLVGNPVGHSVSPVLQNSFFTAMDINGIYVPLKVPAGCLRDAVRGLRDSGFAGFNITIPYKEEILYYADEVTEEVKLLGAANTVKIENGKFFAYNTDGDGFVRAFEEETGTGFEHKTICILGAGGTAKALAVKIALKGARRISIINRTEIKAVELASSVNHVLIAEGSVENVASAAVSGTAEASRMLNGSDIIVNTTSVGMYPDRDSSPLPQDFLFQKKQIVYDVIYNPAQTKLLSNARANGSKTVNGAGMLFYQGLRAFEIIMGKVVPVDISTRISEDFFKYLGT